LQDFRLVQQGGTGDEYWAPTPSGMKTAEALR
jgi:hypothetical protein